MHRMKGEERSTENGAALFLQKKKHTDSFTPSHPHILIPLSSSMSRLPLRIGAFALTFAATERLLTMVSDKRAFNYLTAGAFTSTLFGFAAAQTRRGIVIGGSITLITLPLYLLLTTPDVERKVAHWFGYTDEDIDNALKKSTPERT